MLACRSFCLAMQASLASSVMSTLITNRLRSGVVKHRQLKEGKKSIAPCRGDATVTARGKKRTRGKWQKCTKGEAHEYVCRKIHGAGGFHREERGSAPRKSAGYCHGRIAFDSRKCLPLLPRGIRETSRFDCKKICRVFSENRGIGICARRRVAF